MLVKQDDHSIRAVKQRAERCDAGGLLARVELVDASDVQKRGLVAAREAVVREQDDAERQRREELAEHRVVREARVPWAVGHGALKHGGDALEMHAQEPEADPQDGCPRPVRRRQVEVKKKSEPLREPRRAPAVADKVVEVPHRPRERERARRILARRRAAVGEEARVAGEQRRHADAAQLFRVEVDHVRERGARHLLDVADVGHHDSSIADEGCGWLGARRSLRSRTCLDVSLQLAVGGERGLGADRDHRRVRARLGRREQRVFNRVHVVVDAEADVAGGGGGGGHRKAKI